MRGIFFIIGCLSLTGCQGNWTHPTKTELDFRRDRADCENIIVTKHGGWSRVEPFTAGMEIRECLELRGYVKQ